MVTEPTNDLLKLRLFAAPAAACCLVLHTAHQLRAEFSGPGCECFVPCVERHLNLLPVFVALAIVYYWFLLDARYRLGWRIAGLVIALLVFQLAYLKYRSFIAETFGLALPISAALAALIPLGISFYTFEAISAIVDIKRRKAPAPVPAMSWSLSSCSFRI